MNVWDILIICGIAGVVILAVFLIRRSRRSEGCCGSGSGSCCSQCSAGSCASCSHHRKTAVSDGQDNIE